MTVSALKKKINNKSIKVAIAGMGYVGLPLAKSIRASGINDIYGIDINENKIKEHSKKIISDFNVNTDNIELKSQFLSGGIFKN